MLPRVGVKTEDSLWRDPYLAYSQNEYYDDRASQHGQTPSTQSNGQLNYYMDGLHDNRDCYSASPLNFGQSNSARSRDSEGPRNCEFIEFFGEEFEGMEETFRSALLQYFSQVDKERQDLADDLEKLRSDFCCYQKEMQSTIEQKDKVIRQLTENGKDLIHEIERMKGEAEDGEMFRQHLIIENNDLQKQVTHENEMIPQLENELKSLSEENDYLKLLADDTKKLSQQENEIRKYANDLYRQKKLCQQQSEKISKQTVAFQNLSKINDELCIKINELAHLQTADRKLEGKTKQYNILAGEHHTLQLEHSNLNKRFEEVKQLVDSLESERNEADKEKHELENQMEMMNVDFIRKCKELEKITILNDENKTEASKNIENIRNLQETNFDLQSENDQLHREHHKIRGELDDLIYEDDERNKDFENIKKHAETLQIRCEEYACKLNELKIDIEEKDEEIHNVSMKEEGYKHKIKCIEEHCKGCDDSVKRMEIQVERLKAREKEMESEILTHVKTESENEQQNALMYHTIETLKRNNETCNEQRLQLQSEIRKLEETINQYEIQNKERKSELDLTKEIQEMKAKYEKCDDERFAIQNELFILKRKFTDQFESGTQEETNNSIINNRDSSNIHHKQNESSTSLFMRRGNEGINVLNDENISCTDFKVFLRSKEEQIEDLVDQRNRYQEECRLLSEEIECLKANYDSIENKLDEHNQYIDDLTEQCSKLRDQIQTRNNLINQQEEEIERFQIEIDKISKSRQIDIAVKDIQEYSNNLNRELSEKNEEIDKLHIHSKQLQKTLDTKEKELNVIKTKLASTAGGDFNAQQNIVKECESLNKKVLELEEENFEKSIQIQQLQDNLKTIDRQQATSSVEPELSCLVSANTSTDNQLQIKELEEEAEKLRNCMQSLDYSFEDDRVVSKEKYNDLLECVKTKELIIIDLQEHINLIDSKNETADKNRSIEPAADVNKLAAPKLGLRLPSPDIAAAKKEAFSFHKKRSSLPPIPIDKVKEVNKEQNGAVMKVQRSASSQQGSDDLRSKVIKLNSELLEKKMTINKLEEELKTIKRRHTRLEESHRSTVDKNESIELELIENRKRINDIQTKHTKVNAFNEEKYRKEIQTYRANSEKLQEQCKELHRGRDCIQKQFNEQSADKKILENKLEQLERQMKQWNKNNQALEKEYQNVASRCEKLQAESIVSRDQNFELNRATEIIKAEKESCQRAKDIKGQQIDNMRHEIQSLQDDMQNKVKSNEKAYERIRIMEQERDIFESQVKEDLKTIEKLDKRTKGQNQEIKRLNLEIQEWRKKFESHNLENKELLTVKEINEHNTRYLENKLEECRAHIKNQNNEYMAVKDDNENVKNEIRRLTEELRYSNIDLENFKEQYTNENKNVLNLENLNKDMNKENKKLMLEIIQHKQKIQELIDEGEEYKDTVEKMENEQVTVDRMLTNTQTSNSELLNANKIARDDLKDAHAKIINLQGKLEEDEKQRIIMENKLMSLEKEFENATRDLHEDNKQLTAEVQHSRRLIGEFEAILDQGQIDFDEMDSHLEKYRNENIDLDKRLHEALKLQIQLQSERAEVDQRAEELTEEIKLMRESVESERKFSEMCSKEKEQLEIQLIEIKNNLELHEKQIVNLRGGFNFKLDLLEQKDAEIEHLQKTIDKLNLEATQAEQQINSLKSIMDAGLEESCVDCGHHLDAEEMHMKYEECRKELVSKEQQLIYNFTSFQQLQCEKEQLEDRVGALQSQIQEMESDLEDHKFNREKDVEECLKEISDLRNHITNQEVSNEKLAYNNQKLGYELGEALEQNVQLDERLGSILNENDMERNAMIETIAMLEEKVNTIEDDRGEEIEHLRTAVQDLEKIREQNKEEFEKSLASSHKIIADKVVEIKALKDNVAHLKSNLDKYESKNIELSKSMTTRETEDKLTKVKLIQDLRNQEQSIQILKKKSTAEDEHKGTLMLEVERLTKEIENLRNLNKESERAYLQEKKEMQRLIDGLRDNRDQIEALSIENENLKSDIEYFLSDRKDHQVRYQEISQLRSEVINLRFKLRKKEELATENQRIKVKPDSEEITSASPQPNYTLLSENQNLKSELEKLQSRINQQPSSNQALKETEDLERRNEFLSENSKLRLDLEKLKFKLDIQKPSYEDLMKEKERLRDELNKKNNASIDLIQDSNNAQLMSENRRLKLELEQSSRQTSQQQSNYDSSELVNSLTRENRSLKNEIQNLETLKAEVQSLRIRNERMNELSKENKMLKQELREIESRHIVDIDMLKEENAHLRKQVDDLFKKNQDLELSNISPVHTKQAKIEPLSFKQKAASYDNLSYASWHSSEVSERPTPARPNFGQVPIKTVSYDRLPSPSIMEHRSTSIERVPSFNNIPGPSDGPFIKQMKSNFPNQTNNIKTSAPVKSILKQFGTSQEDELNQSLELPKVTRPDKNRNTSSSSSIILKNRPDVSQISLIAFDEDPFLHQSSFRHDENPKADASWHDPIDDSKELKRAPSFKNNPFFELDRSTAQRKWKSSMQSATKGQSKSASSSPEKLLPRDVRMFDMRPQSTEPAINRRKTTEKEEGQENAIGNEFVKRVKGLFEGSSVTGR